MSVQQTGSRFIRLAITAPLTLLVVLFAISNRQDVPLDIWPFDLDVTFPLYAIVLVSMGVGVIFGAVMAWFSGGRARRRARHAERKVRGLEREMEKVSSTDTDKKDGQQGDVAQSQGQGLVMRT